MQSTKCLVSCVLLNSLSDLPIALGLSYKTISFSVYWLIFLCDHEVDLSWKIWAYSAFELTQKSFPALTDLQVRSSGAACQNSKAFNYKFVTQ